MPHGGDHECPGELLRTPAPASSHLLAACDDSGEALRVGRFYILVDIFVFSQLLQFSRKFVDLTMDWQASDNKQDFLNIRLYDS